MSRAAHARPCAPATILAALADSTLFAPLFVGESWQPWRVALAALFGLPIRRGDDLALFQRCTGRKAPPSHQAREGWFVVGRRGGKSRVMALVAVYLATFRGYRLTAGERGVVMLIAADRRQARVLRRYVGGIVRAVPMLATLVERETADAVSLSTGIDIEIHTASFRTVRGYTIVAAICDEIAFWPVEDAAEPDREIVAALRPAMATIPDALLVAISSPYARRGELHRAHAQHFGRDDDPVLVWQADTRTMHPAIDAGIIEQAYADDEAVAAAEYGARFRSDVETFIGAEALEAVQVEGRFEIPPVSDHAYAAFVDPAGGSGADAMTLAVAHAEPRNGQTVAVLDALREARPPFSPEATVAEFAGLLRTYHVATVTGDRYAGAWPREQFRKAGVEYELSDAPKSDIYRDVLPLVNSGRVELLDHRRLRAQLAGLERRTGRGGKDSIDHAPGGHDDLANAAAGVVRMLARRAQTTPLEIIGGAGGGTYVSESDPLYQEIYRAELAKLLAAEEKG